MPTHGLAAVVRCLFRRVRTFTTEDWDSSSFRFHHVGRVERFLPYSIVRQSRPSPSMLLFPWSFDRR